MEASKVTIEPRTALRLGGLSQQRRNQLRLELAAAYIRSKPYGTRIVGREFMNVCQFNNISSANAWLKTRVKKGELVQHNIGVASFYYTVPEPVTITKSAEAAAVDTPLKPQMAGNGRGLPTASVDKLDACVYTLEQIEDKAMRYSWFAEVDGKIPSVSGFVKWLRSQ